jgi:hypothetical protein
MPGSANDKPEPVVVQVPIEVPTPTKKPYKKPALRYLGTVAELTAGGGSTFHPDGRSGMARNH